MPNNTNRLDKLAQQFDALPRQQVLKQTKIQLFTTLQKVSEFSDSLQVSFDRVKTLREMQGKPDLLSSDLSQNVKKLKSATQSLAQQIQPTGTPSKLTAALDSLGKLSKVIEDQIKASWDVADTDLLQTTQTLIELTGKYDAAAQQKLQQALNQFKKNRNPADQESVQNYRTARERLQQVRAGLNIPGNVGKFLSDAARGAGSIEALLDAEVQAFLNAHSVLRSQLTVKLG